MVSTLAKAPNDQLFDTKLVKILVMNFWGEYEKKVIQYCLIPFCIYFISTVVYFSNIVVDPDYNDKYKKFDFSWEFVNRVITIVGMIYFGAYEVIQLTREGIVGYFGEIWNLFDIGSIILNTFLLCNLLLDLKIVTNNNDVVVMCFIAVFLLWWKILYWFRLFESTSFYIRLIIDSIKGIGYFMMIFFTLLFAFSNAIYILNANRGEEDGLIDEIWEGNPAANAAINQYLLALGEFNSDNFSAGPNKSIVWILFIAATFIS